MKDKDIINALLAAAILDTKKEKETPTKIDKDALRKKSEDLGNDFYPIYLGFKDAGFTDEQAFQLMLNTVRRN